MISPRSAPRLHAIWTAPAHGDVSSAPTIGAGGVFYADWGGYVTKVDSKTGAVLWQTKLTDITGNTKSLSRNSPAIGAGTVVVGDQASGALIALDSVTGSLKWVTTVETHPAAIMTSSPVIGGGYVYAGVSSMEEFLASNRTYTPSFRGSVVAVDLRTGRLVWQFYTAPTGYTGAASWGSNPVYDAARSVIYLGTGNNYTVPASVSACLLAQPKHPDACLAADDYVDSVLAIDARTGKLRWGRRLSGPDAWTAACLSSSTACPPPVGTDFDFGAAPNLFTVPADDAHRSALQVLGIGQKSGIYWALNPDTGKVLWQTPVGPGSIFGGIEFGTASDGRRVYVPICNFNGATYTLKGGQSWNAGSYAALDARTGAIIWQVPAAGADLVTHNNARALAPMSVVNGVVFAGSTGGVLQALDTATGKTLWSSSLGATLAGAVAIDGGNIIIGTGYTHFGIGNAGTGVLAFSVQ